MNYNTLCLKLSSCLHSSTLTSLSTVLFTFLSASLLYASLPPCLSSQLLFFAFFFFCRPFSTSPPARSSFISLHLPLFWLHLFRYISLLFIPFSALSSWPPLLLFTPSVLASPPPLPPSLLHLISDTLTWLSPLLPQEAGEPLFPLIPANAICKHWQSHSDSIVVSLSKPWRYQRLDGA